MLADLKFALRQLTKSPGFTLIAVLTLALPLTVALLACLLPALRATKVDPLIALRTE